LIWVMRGQLQRMKKRAGGLRTGFHHLSQIGTEPYGRFGP
jgi:hypothetical protein